MRVFRLLVVCQLLSSAAVHAQWIPITAKIKQTREVFMNGQKTETHVREGLYYRSSHGATLEEWTRVDGSESKAVGYMTMQADGVTYELHLLTRRAIERRFSVPSGADLRKPPTPPARPAHLRQVTVGGVRCTVIPARMQPGFGQPSVPAGEICISDELNLMVRNEQTHSLSGTKTVRVLYEMDDIQSHKEPDPKLFDLRGRGFTIYTASEPAKPPAP
jgi:hypothetical protein